MGGGWFEKAKPTITPTGIKNVAPKHRIAALKKETDGVLRVPMQECSQESKGHWTHDKILSDLKTIIVGLNHFPTEKELRELNKQGLLGAIQKQGGLNYFRTKLGYELPQKPAGYWTYENITKELQTMISELGHFPMPREFREMDKQDLMSAIQKHGGVLKFRKLLGYDYIKVPNGYWTYDRTLHELKKIITQIGHFPTQQELSNMKRRDVAHAIDNYGGLFKFRKLLGYELPTKPMRYWTHETTVIELKKIITQIGHFPTHEELYELKRGDLSGAIRIHGGIRHFQELLGYEVVKKPDGYWTDERIISELKATQDELTHFPTRDELNEIGKGDLANAVAEHGGFPKFRELCGVEWIKKPNGYWADETIVIELNKIIAEIGHFPLQAELSLMNRDDLVGAISQHGGLWRFRKDMGYERSFQGHMCELHSYITKRGRKTENLVKKILTEYTKIHRLSEPAYNNWLAKGNVIEFICDVGRKIGIDVTNTECEYSISNKWRKKDYYKYLDELWVIVFSDSFTSEDYDHWNDESPENVKVMSIQDFLSELDYSVDEATKCKINRYCACSFHTKEELKRHRQQRRQMSLEEY